MCRSVGRALLFVQNVCLWYEGLALTIYLSRVFGIATSFAASVRVQRSTIFSQLFLVFPRTDDFLGRLLIFFFLLPEFVSPVPRLYIRIRLSASASSSTQGRVARPYDDVVVLSKEFNRIIIHRLVVLHLHPRPDIKPISVSRTSHVEMAGIT